MSRREVRELGLACLCHIAARLALGFGGFERLLRFSTIRLAESRRPLSERQFRRLAELSRRICRGSCLTESVVLKLVAARHGCANWPLAIGVSREGGRFRAHAWTGVLADHRGYVPLWTETLQPDRPRD